MLNIAQRAISAVRDGRFIPGLLRRFDPDRRSHRRDYLQRCKGVVHVGANDGQEIDEYAGLDLNVLWIEPLADPFSRLEANIAAHSKQKAVMALITDRDGDTHSMHLTVGVDAGRCASILKPAIIADLLPEVTFSGHQAMISATLDSVMKERDISLYDALAIDAQGAELMVLRGASGILRNFRYIECEGADFEFYAGYPGPAEIEDFLASHGFRKIREDTFRLSKYGREFDMLFRRGR